MIYYLSTNNGAQLSDTDKSQVLPLLHDRMTESVLGDIEQAATKIFRHGESQPLATVDILQGGCDALASANREMGLALSVDEIEYLVENFAPPCWRSRRRWCCRIRDIAILVR